MIDDHVVMAIDSIWLIELELFLKNLDLGKEVNQIVCDLVQYLDLPIFEIAIKSQLPEAAKVLMHETIYRVTGNVTHQMLVKQYTVFICLSFGKCY